MGQRLVAVHDRTPRTRQAPQATPHPAVPAPHPLLTLQTLAGNQAVTALLEARPARPVAATSPVQRQPAEPNPPAHRGGETWNLEYVMYGKPMVFSGLDDEGAIKKLQLFYLALLDDMRNGLRAQESWRAEMGSGFGTRWAAAASSIAGGADWPDPANWLKVDRQIFDAFLILRESLWAVMAARNDSMDADARAQAKPLTEERAAQVVAILEAGDRAAARAWDDWARFLAKSERGAERAVTGLKVAKVAGAVAVTYLTGGAALEAKLGFWATSTALAATGGTYAATQELAGQSGEMLFGDRDHIDWGSVAKVGAINAAASFVGALVGGKLSSVLGNALGRFVGGLSPEVMQTFGIEGAQLLSNGERIFLQWVGNVAASPFSTSTTVLMQSALDRRWSVTSSGDFLDLVLHDLLVNGSIAGFFSAAHAYGVGSGQAPQEAAPGAREAGGGRGSGGSGGPSGRGAPPRGRPTLRGMGAAGPAGENAPPAVRSGDTMIGMGRAGPAGENAPPATRTGKTLTGMGVARPAPEIEMPAEYVGRRPLVTEQGELTAPIDRDPANRMSASGFPGSLPRGYGVFRQPVRLPTGEVVDAVVKICPGEQAARFESEVAGAMAAARTGRGPRFYGRIPVPTEAQYARPGQPDLAFAMEPVEGAFAHPGLEPGEPGYAAAAAESAQAAGRITEQTLADVHDFGRAILDEGYHYGGSHGGEVQGLIGPDGRWTPIDFQGLNPLPTEPAARTEAIAEQEIWINDEIRNLQKAYDEHHGFTDEDPTDPGR